MTRREAMKRRETTGQLVELVIIIIAGTAGVIFLSSLPFFIEKLLLILK